MPGTVDEIDIAGRSVGFADPEGTRRTMSYPRLLLTVGYRRRREVVEIEGARLFFPDGRSAELAAAVPEF